MSPSLAKDTSDRTTGNREVDNVVRLFLDFESLKKFSLGISNTLFATFDEDLIRLEWLTGPAFGISILTREGDLDGVFLLQTNSILATLANEGGMVFVGNLEDLRSLVGL